MHMFGILLRLAWRNLWRNHRRTLIMLLAIVLGTWAMIFMTALMRGMVSQMVADGISVLPGHVQVHHPDYRDDPSIANLIAVTDTELSEAIRIDAGFVNLGVAHTCTGGHHERIRFSRRDVARRRSATGAWPDLRRLRRG